MEVNIIETEPFSNRTVIFDETDNNDLGSNTMSSIRTLAEEDVIVGSVNDSLMGVTNENRSGDMHAFCPLSW